MGRVAQSLGVAALVLAVAAPAGAASRSRYPRGIEQTTVRSCVAQSDNSVGLGKLGPGDRPAVAAAIGSYCGCVLTRSEATVPLAEFEAADKALTQNRAIEPAVRAKLVAVSRNCLPPLLAVLKARNIPVPGAR